MVNESWQNQWGVMKLADFRAHMTLQEVDPSHLPIGSHRLAEFRRQLQPTDVFYYYDSDPEEWDRGMGSAGYAIVRDGELFDTLVMRMN